ncbi:MAG: DNA repair protein RadA [Acidobacteriota bacterium]
MAKTKTYYRCQECGHRSPKWEGKCSACGTWSSYVEETEETGAGPRRDARPAADARVKQEARPLPELTQEQVSRIQTGISELDRCLGGGLVPGSLSLVGGEPGIGKSTLMLQLAAALAKGGHRVLYVSGEESPSQLRLRADRLGVKEHEVHVLGECDVDAVLLECDRLSPSALIVDSIQVMHDRSLTSAPGTVSQVRQAADRFLRLAKERSIATLLVGHVTKEGALAGPRTLEHLVDTVLSFEAEGSSIHRLLRSLKNRFGPSGEVGVFEMKGDGLGEVPDASRLFLSERRSGAPGSVVLPSLEGTRPVLVEIQALVSPTSLAQPRRTCVGADSGRLGMLLAVLQRRAGLEVVDKDVFVNIVGGMRLRETAADLPLALAIASSLKGQPVPADLAAFGEVGLSGELRSVDRGNLRLREAAALGFKRCLVPRSSGDDAKGPKGLKAVVVEDVGEAIGRVLSGR